MFEPNSRYASLPTRTHHTVDEAGQARGIAHVGRRIIPARQDMLTLAEHVVAPGQRIDHLAAQYFSDPTAFWRIADGHLVSDPDDLLEPGRLLRINASIG